MRKLSFFLAFLMVATFGMTAFGQNCTVSFDTVTGTWNDGGTLKLKPQTTANVVVRYTATDCGPTGSFNTANSFKIWSPDGMDWTYFKGIREQGEWFNAFWAQTFFNHFEYIGGWTKTVDSLGNFMDPNYVTEAALQSNTDSGCVSVSAFTQGQGGGLVAPYDEEAYWMEFVTGGDPLGDLGVAQGTICIDTTTPSGGGAWEWAFLAGGSLLAEWYDAPQCWVVERQPNDPPDITNCPGNLTFSHCETATFTFTAEDDENDFPYVWNVNLGTITNDNSDGTSATWSYNGGPQSGFETLEVTVTDDAGLISSVCTVELTFTNEAPTITCPGGAITVQVGNSASQDVTTDDDCDPLTLSHDYAGAGTVDISGNTVTFTPDIADSGLTCFNVIVDDGEETASCELCWNVTVGAPYEVQIEKLHDVIQGGFADVDVTLEAYDETEGVGGFDLLIAYDQSALSFQQAMEGDIYTDCGWEYFTYRFGPDGNCGNGCPSGLTRVVGLAETNNGAAHPACDVDTVPVSLATLRFLVSNDRTLECQYVPVRFFWIDCGDNVLSNEDGSELYISSAVYDYDNADPIDDGTFGFPGYLGAADFCLEQGLPGKPLPERKVDFYNGGVDIICADSIDARGDLNLNGLAYEIADAVMFTNYFISGLGAFEFVDGAIAASDANADGVPLTVADLVYLIRVIVGDALPYPKLNPMHATYAVENGRVNVDAEMGAAFMVFEAGSQVELLADNMEMKTGVVDGNLHVLVYSTEANQVFTGDFLAAQGEMISAEFATYDGQPVAAKNVPRTFRVEQNYPNPFNPATNIEFALPTGGEWTVDIYNVTGQLVDSFNGVSEPGVVTVEWNASDLASGVYFYRVAAGQNVKTMKAMLLK
ncbi:T9SS type A sorting domain-containing protein [candidate division GN15 bacterium]|nr:T9SS type A sorting domain-containing protein [candidate division GN15 bacterium]